MVWWMIGASLSTSLERSFKQWPVSSSRGEGCPLWNWLALVTDSSIFSLSRQHLVILPHRFLNVPFPLYKARFSVHVKGDVIGVSKKYAPSNIIIPANEQYLNTYSVVVNLPYSGKCLREKIFADR